MNNKSIVALIASVIVGSVFLTGCNDFSGDQYTASQVKSVSNVSYGTIISIRDVKARNTQGGVGATTGALGGAALGGLIGHAVGGGPRTAIGMGLGAAAAGTAGYFIGNRNVKVKEYTIRADNGNIVAITQGEPPVLALNQRVAIQYDQSGAGRVVPA